MGAVSSSRPNLLRALRTVAVKDGLQATAGGGAQRP